MVINFLLQHACSCCSHFGLSWQQSACEWLIVQIKILRESQKLRTVSVLLVLAIVVACNLFQAYELSPQRSTKYQSPVMLFVKLLGRIRERAENKPDGLRFAFVTTPPWGIEGYLLMLQVYDIPIKWVRPDKLDAGNNNLLKGSAGLLRRAEYGSAHLSGY